MTLNEQDIAALKAIAAFGPVRSVLGKRASHYQWDKPTPPTADEQLPRPITQQMLLGVGLLDRTCISRRVVLYGLSDAGRAYLAALDREELSQ